MPPRVQREKLGLTLDDFRQELEDDEEEVLDFLSDGYERATDWDLEEDTVPVNLSIPNVVWVLGLPQVNAEKLPKLRNVLQNKLFSGVDDIDMPMDEASEQTLGFAILTFPSAEAALAAKALDGYSLDKQHSLVVMLADEVEDIRSHPEELEERDTQRAENIMQRADTRDWLVDDEGRAREQILLRYQEETAIYWYDSMKPTPELSYGGEREKAEGKLWCDGKVEWSPQGSFLVTHHKPGVALWGGDEFDKRARLAHKGVKGIQFSPDESFLLTWDGTHHSQKVQNAVKLWRVIDRELLRELPVPAFAPHVGGEWPAFLWSHDGKYLVSRSDTNITIFNPSEKTSKKLMFKGTADPDKANVLACSDVESFDISPTANILAVWSPEDKNTPARVCLVDLQERVVICSRNLFNIADAQLIWQAEGRFLTVKATKLTKSKKTGHTCLGILRVHDKDVPVDMIDIKAPVKAFAWEKRGNRFAVLQTDEQGHMPQMVIFQVAEKVQQVAVLSLQGIQGNFTAIHWAPEGNYFVLSGAGDIIFGHCTLDNKVEILHKAEHFQLTDVIWDPSSRYVTTAVTVPLQQAKYSSEAGFTLWTFYGRKLYHQHTEKLHWVLWRPHPTSLLGMEKVGKIRNELKTYTKKFDRADDEEKRARRQEFEQERKRQLSAFEDYMAEIREWHQEESVTLGWAQAWEELEDRVKWEEKVVTTEEELEKTEEVIS
mmetsp:Transcript_54282/g.118967  ORF Transcript_54282/g.118967 Transcript_54282/m.118967 type:complete len:716 (+) Transcript_54282:39-2186(+)